MPPFVCRQFVLIGFLFVFAVSIAKAQSLAPFEAAVVRVVDGDTVVVLDATKTTHKIRLYGVDAPESKQAFGQVAKQALEARLARAAYQVTVDPTDRDRYGRLIARLWVVEGEVWIDINRTLVADGMAWAYRRYSRDYEAEQVSAQQARRGLWRDAHPIAPWEFRHAR